MLIRDCFHAEAGRQEIEALQANQDMRNLAKIELRSLEERLDTLNRDSRLALLPWDATNEKSASIEIRECTGGNEAPLFAGDLLRMFDRYASA
jgi:peptide chain release factor 1